MLKFKWYFIYAHEGVMELDDLNRWAYVHICVHNP